jgi:ABC-type nitrate/sulfonate/bicarbonate transport system substrate-binding protein
MWPLAVFVALVWLLPSVPTASAQTKVSISHIVIGPNQVPLWIAHEQGLFAKHGTDVQLLHETVTGDFQFRVFGTPATIAAVAAGRDLKVLVSLNSGRITSHLMTRPDVKTPDDLRGQRFGVTRIGTGFWIFSILALEHLGLDPKRDRINFVEVGGDVPRLVQALETGEIDAAMLDPAQGTQLRAKGFSLLLDMSAVNSSAVQQALVVNGAYLRENPELVEKVVAGLVEGIAFSLSPANKDTVLKTLMAHLNITVPAAAESGYQAFLARVNRKPYGSAAALRNVQRVMALNDPKVLNVNVEDLVEDRFVRKLDESGVIDRLYSAYGVK